MKKVAAPLISLFIAGASGKEAVRPAAFAAPAAWEYSAPLIAPEKRFTDPSVAQKDPSVVFHEGRWHVFMTVKLAERTAIEHCAFERWDEADTAPRTLLPLTASAYFGAPQVFYFTPQRRWYLIYQVGMPGVDKMWVASSTTTTLSDPISWSQAQPMLDGGDGDPRVEGGLDYWIICDARRAYLFFTSLNGKVWRMWTELEAFPKGLAHCEIALQADIFEASHTYRLRGLDQFLMIVEANGRRHYKAYLADRLDGEWTPLADNEAHPFAGAANIRPASGVAPWTDNVSHGELVREGVDETMTVDPSHLQFLFQGVLESAKAGKNYGRLPWRIGLLTPAAPAPR